MHGAKYHVTARANRKEMIFESDEMKDLFLRVVKRAKRKYRFKIENFCVMGNHFHFIIQPLGRSNLSRIMQWILSVFAMSWNRLHDLTGHVWGERFYSRIMSSFVDFLRIFMYICDNPVEAGLVKNAEKWKYGGLFHLKNKLFHILDSPTLY